MTTTAEHARSTRPQRMFKKRINDAMRDLCDVEPWIWEYWRVVEPQLLDRLRDAITSLPDRPAGKPDGVYSVQIRFEGKKWMWLAITDDDRAWAGEESTRLKAFIAGATKLEEML